MPCDDNGVNGNPAESLLARKKETRHRYDRLARSHGRRGPAEESPGVRRLRRDLLQRASGRVLEIGVGEGASLPDYPAGFPLVTVDLSPEMLAVASEKADRSGLDVAFLVMDAEALAFRDQSFDTVVSCLTLCTLAAPVAALHEMARVCRPGGRILLLEHGRSDWEWLGRLQDLHSHRRAEELGCYWNRDPLALVRQAGLTLLGAWRAFFGVLHMVEAAPWVPPGNASATPPRRRIGASRDRT